MVLEESGYSLEDKEGRRLSLDFSENSFYQRKGHRGKNELLVKALGIKSVGDLVFDLSGGFLIDASFLARLGFCVHAFEREAAVFLLVQNALVRGQIEYQALKNLELSYMDALRACEKYFQIERPKALYFDPMFPEKKKSLSKLPMQLFQKIVGDDEDATETLIEIRNRFPCRTVVKRPLKAPPLLPDPDHSFVGNIVRYDMYLV